MSRTQEEAVVEQLLSSHGPPAGPWDEPTLDAVKKYVPQLTKAGYVSLPLLQAAKFEDFVGAKIPDACARLLEKTFSGAAAGAGSTSGLASKLQQLAKDGKLGYRFEARIVEVMMAEFSSKTQLALSENHEGLLIKTYESAAAMPRSSTKAFLRESANLAFNGVFADAAPGRSVILVAFKDFRVPKLIKFADVKHSNEIDHEIEVLRKLWAQGVPRIVGPIDAVHSGGHISVLHNYDSAGIPVKRGMEMPLYASTLAHIPAATANEEALLVFGNQLLEALDGVHAAGYAHNDVKASNVFLTSEGDCVLGDFGAATLLNKSPEQWSPTHWPQGVQLCSQWTDRFLLVVTLLERAAVYTLKDRGPHEADLVEATSRLRNSELRDFIKWLLTPPSIATAGQ